MNRVQSRPWHKRTPRRRPKRIPYIQNSHLILSYNLYTPYYILLYIIEYIFLILIIAEAIKLAIYILLYILFQYSISFSIEHVVLILILNVQYSIFNINKQYSILMEALSKGVSPLSLKLYLKLYSKLNIEL